MNLTEISINDIFSEVSHFRVTDIKGKEIKAC